jgi:hypothetical protein
VFKLIDVPGMLGLFANATPEEVGKQKLLSALSSDKSLCGGIYPTAVGLPVISPLS